MKLIRQISSIAKPVTQAKALTLRRKMVLGTTVTVVTLVGAEAIREVKI